MPMSSDEPGKIDEKLGDGSTSEIDPSALRNALWKLHFLGGDLFLRLQATNLAVVDHFITELERRALAKLVDEERTPIEDVTFLSAQSQMWIFAVYELRNL